MMKSSLLSLVTIVAILGFVVPVSAQENETLNFINKILGRGAPGGRRKGAASRGCSASVTPIALVPDPEKTWALTGSSSPRFWFYIPQLPDQVRSAEFVIQDVQDNDIYRVTLPLNTKPGLLRVALPNPKENVLETGKTYRWTFQIPCEENDRVVLEGYTGKEVSGKTVLWLDKVDALTSQIVLKPDSSESRKAWIELMQELELSELKDVRL